MDGSTTLILEMVQNGLTWDKVWLLMQIILAMAIMASIWRMTQLVIAGAELYFSKKLQRNTWLWVGTPTGQVRHKLLKKCLFRTYFYNYENKSLVVKSNILFMKEPKEFMTSSPCGIDASQDKMASDFGL